MQFSVRLIPVLATAVLASAAGTPTSCKTPTESVACSVFSDQYFVWDKFYHKRHEQIITLGGATADRNESFDACDYSTCDVAEQCGQVAGAHNKQAFTVALYHASETANETFLCSIFEDTFGGSMDTEANDDIIFTLGFSAVSR